MKCGIVFELYVENKLMNVMNKIVLNLGLLVFFISIIFFSRTGMPVQDVILKAFLIFFFLTVMLSIAAIVFMKSINKVSLQKKQDLNTNL